MSSLLVHVKEEYDWENYNKDSCDVQIPSNISKKMNTANYQAK